MPDSNLFFLSLFLFFLFLSLDDTTGTHSVYTMIRGFQIMFHVSIFLPHREGDEQRLDKKRHLGNDVVVVVFCDSEDVRFDPLEIHSQFNHVFVVVVPQPRAPNGKRQYRIAVVRKPGVPAIQPSLKVRGVDDYWLSPFCLSF